MFRWGREQGARACFFQRAVPRKALCTCLGPTCFRKAVQKRCCSTWVTEGLESCESIQIDTGRRADEKARNNANLLERSLCERSGVGAAVPGVVPQEPYAFNEGRRAYGSSRHRCEGPPPLCDCV